MINSVPNLSAKAGEMVLSLANLEVKLLRGQEKKHEQFGTHETRGRMGLSPIYCLFHIQSGSVDCHGLCYDGSL